jgi:hypothetical protein
MGKLSSETRIVIIEMLLNEYLLPKNDLQLISYVMTLCLQKDGVLKDDW